MYLVKRLAVSGIALLWLLGGASAQERGAGIVEGTVVDGDNAPLGGVKVAIRVAPYTNPLMVAETNKEGRFRFENVPEGKGYAVGAQLGGYRSVAEEGLRVVADKTTTISLEMMEDGLRGLVTSPDGAPVMIDLGTRDGVRPRMRFRVYRDRGDYLDAIASIEVGAEPGKASCRCRLTGTDQDERPRTGDTVIQATGRLPSRIPK